MDKIAVLIPCYNEETVLPVTAPDFIKKLEYLIQKNKISSKSKIMFVNDGSKAECASIFEELKNMNCKVFSHHKNYGKGRALKNAFNQLKKAYDEAKGMAEPD